MIQNSGAEQRNIGSKFYSYSRKFSKKRCQDVAVQRLYIGKNLKIVSKMT